MMNNNVFDTKDSRKWLKSLLKEREVVISFTKKDGTERMMRCTLAESVIPMDKMPKNTKKVKSDETLAVFDVEKSDWRSFRWDSVQKVDFLV